VIEVKVGEPHLLHIGVLKQVVCTRRALKSGAKNKHSHLWDSSVRCEEKSSRTEHSADKYTSQVTTQQQYPEGLKYSVSGIR